MKKYKIFVKSWMSQKWSSLYYDKQDSLFTYVKNWYNHCSIKNAYLYFITYADTISEIIDKEVFLIIKNNETNEKFTGKTIDELENWLNLPIKNEVTIE